MALVAVDPASGALLQGGRKLFPLCLSNGPPADRNAPSGRNGLAEVAAAGINMVRTGSAAWGVETAPGLIALERQKLDAAASHGLFGWLWLGDLTDLPPRTDSVAAVRPRAPSPDGRQRPRVAPRARGLEGRRRAAEPRPRRRVDPPGRARPRLRAREAARSSPSARRDPGPGQHRRPADALPARVRPDRHGRLPGVVSARESTAVRRTRPSRSSATGRA